ncbi:MAG: hypothetical protein Q9219_004975 [cf. Caloplaca sp. 3 TL-2023]
MQQGDLVRRIAEIHSKYGQTVRVAPNELSFINPAACLDIYGARGAQPNFPKNAVWVGKSVPKASGILNADDGDHARIRKVWGHAFTDRALKSQEPMLQHYVGIFIDQLRALPRHQDVDIVQWLNFLTFDLTADLAFGESFACLEGSSLHPWIMTIFSHFKSATLLASIQFYPYLYDLLIWFLPASVLKKQQEHFGFAKDKVSRRLNLEKERPDFLQHVLEHSRDQDALTPTEIERTAATMIVAGSETTGTLLSAIISYLIKNPQVMKELVDEICSAYKSEDEMTASSLAKLQYLDAVIRETLRIAPPVPAGMSRVVPTGGARVCGEWLPEQTFVSYPQFAACRSPLNFSDSHSFAPSRWLPSAPTSQILKREALQPFSMGPRNCIGQRLAWTETRLILARLLWNFDLGAVEGKSTDWEEQKTYTLWEKRSVWIRMWERGDQAG